MQIMLTHRVFLHLFFAFQHPNMRGSYQQQTQNQQHPNYPRYQ
ncbi:unnamed protein product [Rodentolepis nana]|uniref:Uncharacterized protein n=1 Tax=Rodentolepis nana TaxID=102285 RepID=A0A0R3T9V6_RODNA|nr:unnamed protein product [Rodentolepis nana]